MKKTVKRVTTLAIVLVMLCAMAIAALAVTEKGSFTVTFANNKYSAKYTETFNVGTNEASASLSISEYEGVYDAFTAARLTGYVSTATGNGKPENIGYLEAIGGLSCSNSCEYKNNGYRDINGVCEYSFMGTSLPTLTDSAD